MIENVENNALNCVSISSAGARGMTHCDFSARSARDEMRHIIGSNQPDVVIGSDKDQNRGRRKKDKDHTEFLCKLCEAQVARGRYFVQELTSEAGSRVRCVAQIMAMLVDENRGLAACDEGDPGFVSACVRTIPNARQVGMRLQSKCTGTHRHARVNTNNTTNEQGHGCGKSLKQLRNSERKRKVEDAKRIRRVVHKKTRTKK